MFNRENTKIPPRNAPAGSIYSGGRWWWYCESCKVEVEVPYRCQHCGAKSNAKKHHA